MKKEGPGNVTGLKFESRTRTRSCLVVQSKRLPNGAMLYQPSYEATHWERGQYIEFISPVRSEML